MKKNIILALILAASTIISARATLVNQECGDAFALASEPDKPILVFADDTPWLFKEGRWVPCVRSMNGFVPVDEADQLIYLSIKGYGKKLAFNDPPSAEPNSIILYREKLNEFGPNRVKGQTKLVKLEEVSLPNELNEGDYIGTWKAIWGASSDIGCYKKSSTPDFTERYFAKIRPDRKRIDYDKRYKESSWDSCVGKEYNVCELAPANTCYRQLPGKSYYWYDKNTDTLYDFKRDAITAMKRSNETFLDPLERCKNMAEDKSYHGAWGVNYEFNIMILSFDRSGKGSMMFFMGGVLFDWKVEGEDIICTFDNDTVVLAGAEWKTMTCRYDPGENKMTIVSLDGDATPNAIVGESYELLSWEVQVDELIKRFEQMKQQPGYKFELERAKYRRKRTF